MHGSEVVVFHSRGKVESILACEAWVKSAIFPSKHKGLGNTRSSSYKEVKVILVHSIVVESDCSELL